MMISKMMHDDDDDDDDGDGDDHRLTAKQHAQLQNNKPW